MRALSLNEGPTWYRNTPAASDTPSAHVTVYRGTSRGEEIRLWAETDGYILSEAALDGYHSCVGDGYEFGAAWHAGLSMSELALGEALTCWGGPAHYSLAHSLFGTDLAKSFGKRAAVSWSTAPAVAEHFAGPDGYVFKTTIPVVSILNPEWGKNDEAEVLVQNGAWATVHVWPKASR